MQSTTGLLVVGGEARARQEEGWRTGRPVEDPDKVKRWGFVSAKPSEHLIHVRRGRLTRRTGQGSTCFKWPWDSVAIVPTSLQRLSFRADQVTAEKVGVEVVGLAVYRIAEPLLAFRVLNFSYPERAQQKLEDTLTGMFVGATRRIVATLSVEDCLRKRKSALAEELLREIAPVVGGEGSPDDTAERGWGVVIDTIEIQEVRVLSETVFAAMQAPFRADIERQAREARALAEQAMAERETTCRRETELLRGQVEAEIQRAHAESTAQQAVRAAELGAIEAEALIAWHEQRLQAQLQSAELARAGALASAELARITAEAARDEGIARAQAELENARVVAQHADAEARVELAKNLPRVAEGLGQAFSQAKLTHIGAGDSPFSQLAAALTTLVDLAREK